MWYLTLSNDDFEDTLQSTLPADAMTMENFWLMFVTIADAIEDDLDEDLQSLMIKLANKNIMQ